LGLFIESLFVAPLFLVDMAPPPSRIAGAPIWISRTPTPRHMGLKVDERMRLEIRYPEGMSLRDMLSILEEMRPKNIELPSLQKTVAPLLELLPLRVEKDASASLRVVLEAMPEKKDSSTKIVDSLRDALKDARPRMEKSAEEGLRDMLRRTGVG